MEKLTIIVPSDSGIAHYLCHQPVAFRITEATSATVVFSYLGAMQPSAKISQLLTFFDPPEFTINKSTSGIHFIVWSL